MSTSTHVISLQEAIALTARYRASKPLNGFICETFEKQSVLALLSTPSAENLRIYMGEKENGDICAVLVAANAEGSDLLPVENNSSTDTEDDAIILEEAIRCPPICPPDSPLNT
jgi:hypothetical protein